MRLKAEDPYFSMIKCSGRKVEVSAYSISKKMRFVGYFTGTNMNLLFQRKCVNSAVESIYIALVNTWSTFDQHNFSHL